MIKNALLVTALLFLASCGGDSDSGGQGDGTGPDNMTAASFVGVYMGNLTVTAEAIGITETDTFPITITVTEDGLIRFDGDDPGETSSTTLANDGTFVGNLPINEPECSGNVVYTGSIVNTIASGDLDGSGSCDIGLTTVDVTLEGTFSASR
ncbi:hypothetical protein N9060_00405 [Arenicella sp.]|nr:hypothetical protein [Arenicella sp.]